MADRQQLEFVIHKDGTVDEHMTGIAGSGCETVTKNIEQALGDIVRREHTPDFYREAQATGASQVENAC